MIETKSAFYYGHTVDQNNNIILFNEGSGDLEAEISYGTYSLTDYSNAVVVAMNSISTNSYTVLLDRDTRKMTISGTANFTLDVNNASVGNTAFPLMGFTTQKTGSNSYAADEGSGSVYLPQFYLQGYSDFTYNKRYLQGTVKESASGIPEIVSFGLSRFMKCDIKFINNYTHRDDAVIEENLSGLNDAINFMDYAISKGPMEFMEDRDTRATFVEVILEKTPTNSNGIGYILKELPTVKGYYDTGMLEFREL